MRCFARMLVLAGTLAALGCGARNEKNYAHAAMGTGLAIAGAGVHRAITGGCWARCSPGYLCNEESGLCELGECLPGCEVGFHCVRDVRGHTLCARDGDGASVRSSLAVSPPPSAPVVVDAGAGDAEPPPDATAHDASSE